MPSSNGILMVLFLCVAGQSVAAEPPVEASELIRHLEALRTDHHISALGLTVVDVQSENGPCNFAIGLGTVSHDSDEPVDSDTVFRLGSVTKGFTALTLLRLQKRKSLSLDSPLSRWLDPGLWENRWQAEAPVTLAQLLEHTAGFADLSQAEWDSAAPLPLAQALEQFASTRVVRWQPGEWASYTNVGAGLVARAMEVASGRDFESLVRSELLGPLGMHDSGFDAGMVRVTGYDRDGTTPIPYWHTVYRAFGGLNASVNDMTRYLRLHLQKGRVGGRRLFELHEIDRVERPTTSATARLGLDFGYGLGNYTWLRDGVLFHGHGGDADGYLSRFAYSHELRRGYFLVINAFNSRALASMRAEVERYLAADFEPRVAPVALHLTPEEHGWIEGEYAIATRRFDWTPLGTEPYPVRLSGGLLRYRSADGWRDLLGVTAGPELVLLRRRDHNRATAIAYRAPDGVVRLVDDDLNLQRIQSE